MELYRAQGLIGAVHGDLVADFYWEPVRDQALRLLAARNMPRAEELLRTIPFQLYVGMIGMRQYGFHILAATVSDSEYARIPALISTPHFHEICQRMITALNDCGIPDIRLIQVEGDLAPGSTPPVETVDLESSSKVVRQAIIDAGLLLSAGSSVSAVDRMHTALHGYLVEICSSAGLGGVGDELSLAQLWKKLRTDHPAFRGDIPHISFTDRLMGGITGGLDVMGPLRNRGSMAHPNENLLQEPEARLAVNFAHSVLNYVNGRLKAAGN